MDAISLVAVAVGGLALGSAGGWVLARRRTQRISEALPLPVANSAPTADAAPTTCHVPRCPGTAQLRGLCRKHYGKAYRLGFLDELTQDRLERLAEDRRKHPRGRPGMLRVVESR